MGVLFNNILATVQWRLFDRIHDSYFDHIRVIVYDLDIEDDLRNNNKRRISEQAPYVEYRPFDYATYPPHFNIKVNAGEYAWKPTIIEEVVREEQVHIERDVNLVYWIDSGLVISLNCVDFDSDVKHCLEHGLYTPRNGAGISKSTDKRTAEYLKLSDELYYSRSTFAVSAGIFLVDVKNRTIYDKIVKPWTECARVKQCIAPDGSCLRDIIMINQF